MLGLAWLATSAAALPTWDALLPPEDSAGHTWAFAPDGSGLLWQTRDRDDVLVHLRWLPDGEALEPLRVDSEEDVRVFARWALPAEPRVLVIEGEERTRFAHRDGSWEEVGDETVQWPGFPGAPEAQLKWDRGGGKHRYTLTRRAGDEVTDTWRVRFRPDDRALWDVEGRLRAIGTPRRRGHRYRSVDERPLAIPRYVPSADPYRNRDTLRRMSMPLTVVGETLWALESRGHEHTAVVTVDLASGDQATVFEAPGGDVLGTLAHPDTGVPDAALVYDRVPRWVAFGEDAGLADDLDWVRDTLPEPVVRLARARGDRRWHACGEAAPSRTVCAWFDRDSRRVFRTLEVPIVRGASPPGPTHPIAFRTDDGLDLDHYLVLPPDVDGDRPPEPLPAVVLVHGGPFGRVSHAHVPMRAFLASRGYAVLDVNYRGSTLLGRTVLDAGTGERGRAIEGDDNEEVAMGQERSAAAWIYRTATRAALDRIRLRKASEDTTHRLPDVTSVPDRVVETRQLLDQLADQLPEESLAMLILWRIDGMSQPEVAEVLRTSERTVRRRLEVVKLLLERLGVDDVP